MSRRTRCALAASLLLLLAASPALGRTIDLAATPASLVVRGREAREAFGSALCAADLDGDGAAELAVGAPGLSSPDGPAAAGGVFVFARSALASPRLPVVARDDETRLLPGPAAHSGFGVSLASGDLNADGLDDLVIGAPGVGGGYDLARGAVYVYFGAEDFLDGTPRPPAVILGDVGADRLGASIHVADLDGDGYPELVAAAPGARGPSAKDAGFVFVVPAHGLPAPGETLAVSDASAGEVRGDHAGDALTGLADADLDGDGRPELLLGAYCADAPDERVDAGVLAVVAPSEVLGARTSVGSCARGVVTGELARGFLGRSIHTGDIDADGLDDVLVSAYAAGDDGDAQARGAAYVLFGNVLASVGTLDLLEAEVPKFVGRRWDLLGLPVLLADLNGDANDDIVIASQFADAGDERQRCGRVSLFWGSLPSVVSAKAGSPDRADVTILGERAFDALGGSLLAADVVGGPSPDLVVGAPEAGFEGAPSAGQVVIVSDELLRP